MYLSKAAMTAGRERLLQRSKQRVISRTYLGEERSAIAMARDKSSQNV